MTEQALFNIDLASIKALREVVYTGIQSCKIDPSYKKYDDLEYDLFYFANELDSVAKKYGHDNIDLDDLKMMKYEEIRPLEKHESTTEKKVEQELKDVIMSQKRIKERLAYYRSQLNNFIRIAEHIKSGFIREMSEAKRLATLGAISQNG